MRHTFRYTALVLVVLLLSVWAILPPEWVPRGARIGKLSLGKDLKGGVTLVYGVGVKPGDPPDTLSRVMEVLKRRVDPNGQLEISMVPQGADRIEITMPLPTDRVIKLKKDFEQALTAATSNSISQGDLQGLLETPADKRQERATELARGDAGRRDAMLRAAAAYDTLQAGMGKYKEQSQKVRELQRQLASVQASGAGSQELVTAMQAGLDAAKKDLEPLAAEVAPLQAAFEAERDAVLSTAVPQAELRAALQKPNQTIRLTSGASGEQVVELPSPRAEALKTLKDRHPGAAADIDRVVAAWDVFEQNRQTLDDPADLIRLLKGAGVLNFRITANPGAANDEAALRQKVAQAGPRNAGTDQVKWYKINKIQAWYGNAEGAKSLKDHPQAFFQSRGYVVEPYGGDYYMLCWDTPGNRLTEAEGGWKLTNSREGRDQLGRPAIDFEMDPVGGARLGDMTQNNVGNRMAVLLDDQVYTAPVLRDRISRSGQISGDFSSEEIQYITQVLSAGSLQAKLSPEPISQNNVGPTLGADNLTSSLTTGVVAFILVASFMVAYYFGSGAIAVVALIYNFILVLGVMALNQAAFTVPGIAGIVLTFGQAVDSNVLIYERMREEFLRGADMKNAVRLGFSRALSPIVDGNISNLIICAVLNYFGTQEIRGFAITLGVGVLTTLFSSLVVSRLLFTLLMTRFGWSHASQLPMKFPAVQRALSPHVDWMKHRHALLGGLIVFLAASAAITVKEWHRLPGTEFVGGTQIELHFKTDPKTNEPVTLTRRDVEERLTAAGRADPSGQLARFFEKPEIVPVNPRSDHVTSDRFRIRLEHANDKLVMDAITRQFADVMEGEKAVRFEGAGVTAVRSAPVFPILSRSLGENIGRPALADDVGAFTGGVAVVMDHLDPAPTRESLVARIEQMRQQPEYASSMLRQSELRVIEGTNAAVRSAVLLTRDESVTAFGDPDRWEREVAGTEWRLVNDALSRTGQPASIQSFSPAIARTFAAQGIVSTVLSLLLLTIYVFARFGTLRWAIAATLPLFADVIGIVGMLAVAQWLCESELTRGFARSIGLLPFKLDLAQIAAMLTIVGYSLNDKIIILDRIRENKGKLPYASYATINDSINQTLSRTLITAGAHMITTIVLYLYGGEAVRGFAYTFNLGVLLGTYTSIVSTPLVWSRAAEDASSRPGATGGAAGARPSSNGTSGVRPTVVEPAVGGA